ncbi:MAG: MBL fold metallo-hydrolase [Spirochaetia bacterium]
MTVQYGILGSGSKANAYIFSYHGFSFVVDNGYSFKEFSRRADSLGFNTTEIGACFLTHMHSDHSKGIPVFSRKLGVPVYMHRNNRFSPSVNIKNVVRKPISHGESVSLRGLKIRSFRTYHDSPNSMSFSFEFGGKCFSIITDTGKIDTEMTRIAGKSDVLFLEANYCVDLLRNGPYPIDLQERIDSDHGHLSNSEAIQFLNILGSKGFSGDVYFCHLSENNNSPETLQSQIDQYLRWNGSYTICPRDKMVLGA